MPTNELPGARRAARALLDDRMVAAPGPGAVGVGEMLHARASRAPCDPLRPAAARRAGASRRTHDSRPARSRLHLSSSSPNSHRGTPEQRRARRCPQRDARRPRRPSAPVATHVGPRSGGAPARAARPQSDEPLSERRAGEPILAGPASQARCENASEDKRRRRGEDRAHDAQLLQGSRFASKRAETDPRARRDHRHRRRHHLQPGAGAAGASDVLGVPDAGHADGARQDHDLLPRRRPGRARHRDRQGLAQRRSPGHVQAALRRPGRELRPEQAVRARTSASRSRPTATSSTRPTATSRSRSATRPAHAARGRGARRRPRHGAVLPHAPGPRSALGDGHDGQARPRARPRLPRPQGRPRPGRPDDHRRQGRDGLVQADAGQARGRLPRPDLRRQARADLVGRPAVRR